MNTEPTISSRDAARIANITADQTRVFSLSVGLPSSKPGRIEPIAWHHYTLDDCIVLAMAGALTRVGLNRAGVGMLLSRIARELDQIKIDETGLLIKLGPLHVEIPLIPADVCRGVERRFAALLARRSARNAKLEAPAPEAKLKLVFDSSETGVSKP
jgi:hypothetical protein